MKKLLLCILVSASLVACTTPTPTTEYWPDCPHSSPLVSPSLQTARRCVQKYKTTPVNSGYSCTSVRTVSGTPLSVYPIILPLSEPTLLFTFPKGI